MKLSTGFVSFAHVSVARSLPHSHKRGASGSHRLHTQLDTTMAESMPVGGEEPAADLTFTPEFASVPSTEVALTFNVRLQAPEVRDDGAQRAVVSLTSVLDKSGSMQGAKLDLVKRASHFVLAQLSSSDTHGVVEYDHNVTEIVPLSRASEDFKAEARNMISSIQAGSTTNLSGGLFQGIQQQVANKYIDWTGASEQQKQQQPPSAPSGPPSDTSSFVHVDGEDAASVDSDVDSIASSAVDVGVVLQEQQGMRAALSGLWGRVRGQSSPAQSPVAVPRTAGPAVATPVRAPSRSFARRLQRPAPCAVRRAIFGGQTPPQKKELDDDAVRSVFLFTDGQANEGVVDKAKLVSMVQKMVDAEHPVRVHTFGFGSDHSEELLSSLAEAGCGSYYYIDKEENIATAFADALGGLMSVAMQNISLTFEPAEGVSIDAVHTPFPTSNSAGNGRSLRIGDLLSEEAKDTLIDVRLPALSHLAPDESVDFKVGELHASYLDVTSASMKAIKIDCLVKRSRDVAGIEPARSVSVQRARIDIVQVLEESRAHADRGDYTASRRTLDACAERLDTLVESARSAQDAMSAGVAQVLRSDIEQARQHTSTVDVYRMGGRKKMQMNMQSLHWQRAANVEFDVDEAETLEQELSEQVQGASASSVIKAASAVRGLRSGTKLQENLRSCAKSFR